MWWTIAGLAALWLVTVQSDLGDLAGDSAKYVALAQALVTGQGYRSIYLAGAPLHGEVPFLFPLALTPIVALAGLNAWWLHVWMVLLSALALTLVWRHLQERTDATTALLVIFLTGSSLVWWEGVSRIMSDVPFVGLAALTCDALNRYRRAATVIPPPATFAAGEPRPYGRGHRAAVAVAGGGMTARAWLTTLACLVAAFYLRTAGVALGVAAALCLLDGGLRDRRLAGWWRRTTGLMVAWLALCGLWYWYAASAGEPPYLFQWRQVDPMSSSAATLGPLALAQRGALNLLYYAAEIARLWCPWHEQVSPWPALTAWPLAAVVVIGWWSPHPSKAMSEPRHSAAGWVGGWRRERGAEEWFVLVYFGMIVLWSYRDSRFLLPILPWLWLYALTGLRTLLCADGTSSRWGSRVYAGYLLLLAVLVSGLMGMRLHQHLQGRLLGENQRQYIEANQWLDAHTPTESVVMSSKPSVTWWYSRRQAVDYPPVMAGESSEAVRAAIAARGADYLLLDGFSAAVNEVIVPALLADPAGLRLAAAFGRSVILRRVGASPPDGVERH